MSRRASKAAIDGWLQANAGLVEFEEPELTVRRLRAAGLYSAKTSGVDVRLSYQRRCLALGLSYATGPTGRTN